MAKLSTTSPGLSSIPPEYILEIAAMAGIYGPGAAGRAFLFYGALAYGPDLLRYFAGYLESLEEN